MSMSSDPYIVRRQGGTHSAGADREPFNGLVPRQTRPRTTGQLLLAPSRPATVSGAQAQNVARPASIDELQRVGPPVELVGRRRVGDLANRSWRGYQLTSAAGIGGPRRGSGDAHGMDKDSDHMKGPNPTSPARRGRSQQTTGRRHPTSATIEPLEAADASAERADNCAGFARR